MADNRALLVDAFLRVNHVDTISQKIPLRSEFDIYLQSWVVNLLFRVRYRTNMQLITVTGVFLLASPG